MGGGRERGGGARPRCPRCGGDGQKKTAAPPPPHAPSLDAMRRLWTRPSTHRAGGRGGVPTRRRARTARAAGGGGGGGGLAGGGGSRLEPRGPHAHAAGVSTTSSAHVNQTQDSTAHYCTTSTAYTGQYAQHSVHSAARRQRTRDVPLVVVGHEHRRHAAVHVCPAVQQYSSTAVQQCSRGGRYSKTMRAMKDERILSHYA